MTEKEYFESHIPHRINLLLTFQERFSNMSNEHREKYRDLFRCSKDISILMVRFLLGELGLRLGKGDNHISPYQNKEWKERINNFKINPLKVAELEKDTVLYQQVLITLKAANRAVAHIEDKDVDHDIRIDKDEKILLKSIEFTVESIRKNMYQFTNRDYESIMNIDDNKMYRERVIL